MIPNGKPNSDMVFLMNGAGGSASVLRILKQCKSFAYTQQSGPILHTIWTDSILIFSTIMVLNFKL